MLITIRFYLTLAGLLFISLSSFAQFGDLIKNKVEDAIKEKGKEILLNKLKEAQEEYDTTRFNYAIALSDNSGLYEHKSRQSTIRKLSIKMLEDEDSDEQSPMEKAKSYNNMGEMTYANNINYLVAEAYFESALDILESNQLKDTYLYPKVLANLGLLYQTMGRYTEAEAYTDSALTLRKNRYGMENNAFGASMNNRAVLDKDLGNYNVSEARLDSALQSVEASLGKESMPYGILLNNKAILYQSMGRYKSAESLLQKTLDIAKKHMNERSGNYQKFLTNQALLYQQMENYEKAEEIYLHVIDLKESRFGKRHPDYAHMQSNLAALYMEMGKTDKVEGLLTDAVDIYEAKFGKSHPAYASAVSNLGNYYLYLQEYEKASGYLEDAAGIRRSVLGTRHPDYVSSREDLAILNWKQGHTGNAAETYKEVLDQSLDFIVNYFPPMSEAEKTQYWDQLKPRFQRFYAFATENHKERPQLLTRMYNYRLATKALLLNATTRIKNQILNSGNQQLIKDYKEWIALKEKLAGLYSFTKEELREENIDLDSMENAANAMEKSLSERSDLFAEGYDISQTTFSDVQSWLSIGEAAVEMIRFHTYKNNFTDTVHYAALINKPDQENPELALMKNGNMLENRYFSYYKNAIQNQIEDEYSYNQYWKAIEPHVEGGDKVFLSQDGIFHQINIQTLRRPSGKYLFNDYDITLLSNTKELKQLKAERGSEQMARNATLIGYPDYGSGGQLAPLPGTRKEVGAINDILGQSGLQAGIYLQEEATESAVKKLENPGILHVGTHGYFLEDVDALNSEKVFGIELDRARNNPLLRSGLMLANAEQSMGTMETRQLTMDDNGILTAYEAANLPLRNTRLVVLSACETGLGDVKSGEGVYGLQRAFRIAGADALVMSLWKVDDVATQKLMTYFYKEWMRIDNRKQALKNAKYKLKQEYPDPYYWGAFVMVGE